MLFLSSVQIWKTPQNLRCLRIHRQRREPQGWCYQRAKECPDGTIGKPLSFTKQQRCNVATLQQLHLHGWWSWWPKWKCCAPNFWSRSPCVLLWRCVAIAICVLIVDARPCWVSWKNRTAAGISQVKNRQNLQILRGTTWKDSNSRILRTKVSFRSQNHLSHLDSRQVQDAEPVIQLQLGPPGLGEIWRDAPKRLKRRRCSPFGASKFLSFLISDFSHFSHF